MIGDVVRIENGLVGVVGEDAPLGQFRVFFVENSLMRSSVQETLDPPSFEVGDWVTLWPDAGTITDISADVVTVEALRQSKIAEGEYVTWTATLHAPVWQITRYNDARIDGTGTP